MSMKAGEHPIPHEKNAQVMQAIVDAASATKQEAMEVVNHLRYLDVVHDLNMLHSISHRMLEWSEMLETLNHEHAALCDIRDELLKAAAEG